MMIVKRAAAVAAVLAALACAMPAAAAPVSCGNAILGNRQLTVDPALAGGFCYAQNGNFTNENTFFASLLAGLAIVDKDTTEDFPGGDPAPGNEGALAFTRTDGTSGTWAFLQSLWDTYDRLFLAAHYGGGGDTSADNPDSFIVELSPFDFTGTYALTGVGIQFNDLSNIYLLGIRCETPGCNDRFVPEPGTLLLLGLGALAFGVRRRLAR